MRPALVLAAGLLAAGLSPAPASAAPDTIVGLDLPRGAGVRVPHVEGSTIVDGSLRIRVEADTVRYLGRSGTSYVVEAAGSSGRGQILRVAPDGTKSRLARANGYPTRLSDDGQQLVSTRQRRDRTTTITVRSAATGARLAQRRFRGYVSTLDVDAGRVLLGGLRRTATWTTGTGSVSVLTGHEGYFGDLGNDLVAIFVQPPLEGGCTRILRISTGATLLDLCREQVIALNPDASRIATISSYADGPIGLVTARSIDGSLLGRYRAGRTATIGSIAFESPTSLLLELIGARRTGTARCTGTGCELAGRPHA